MTLAACGSARVLQRTQTGGVIELQGDRGKAMEQANQEMAAHCGPNNFTITQEGEEAIGTDTVAQENQSTDSKTSKNGRRAASDTTTTQTQSTRTATAWRVHYNCGGGAVGGPPPGQDMGPPPGPPPAAPPSQPGGW
ncbi:MAG: hypothetical protein ABIY55_24590 [Kofleriaceae bacterium]